MPVIGAAAAADHRQPRQPPPDRTIFRRQCHWIRGDVLPGRAVDVLTFCGIPIPPDIQLERPPLNPQEDDMRAFRFRPYGKADQFIAFSCANPEQLLRLGMDVEPLHVVPFTAGQLAAIERDLGIKLTAHKE